MELYIHNGYDDTVVPTGIQVDVNVYDGDHGDVTDLVLETVPVSVRRAIMSAIPQDWPDHNDDKLPFQLYLHTARHSPRLMMYQTY